MNASSHLALTDAVPSGTAGPLRVALPRRVVLQQRGDVPVIYYGAQVIAFDQPELAPLASLIADDGVFDRADLSRQCPMASPAALDAALAALTGAGLLTRAPGDTPQPRLAAAPDLPPGTLALDWSAASEIGQRLLGQPIHPAHLELVIPVFRIAHPMLDADDRQVGEANVFPRALRQDRPTEWQACTYSGTRHRDDKPMNLTALKAMRAHWPQMMAVLADIRAAYLARARLTGPLTLGQIERLCIAVLSLPTWAGLGGAPLDPVLSSLFRVTDGLRLVVHQMMFIPTAEPMLPPQTWVTASEIFDYAERSLSFHSDTGVCAGPQHFIREFLEVLIDGAAPRLGAGGRVGPAVSAALAELDLAMDYGFAALAAHAAVFAVWTEMATAWAEIAALAETWPQGASPELDRFRAEAAEAARRLVHASYLGQPAWRAMRLATYAEIEIEAQRLSRKPLAVPAALRRHLPQAGQLADALPGLPDPAALANILSRFADRAGAHLSRAAATQARLACQLQRPPAPGFALADMTLHSRLVADPGPRLQFLPDALAALTGLALRIETVPEASAPGASELTGTGPVNDPRESRAFQQGDFR